MRKTQDFGNIGNMSSHIDVVRKQNMDMEEQNQCPARNPRANLYSLCIGCPDYPQHCNGPKLSEFLAIMLLRDFMRKIRDFYKITNDQIAEKTNPFVSKATVAEFFSNKEKDFLWTTVAYIDHSMKVIILERQLGSVVDADLVLDNPCPASSSKIKGMLAESSQKLQASEDKCRRLEIELELCGQSKQQEIQRVRDDDAIKIEHLKTELAQEKRTAERRYNLIVYRDWIIILLILVCVALLILAVMYLSWDFTHDGAGIFW